MKRILLSAAILLAAGAFIVLAGGASSSNNSQGTYKIELDNAFGLVTGADFKVAGVRAGTIQSINLDQKTLHAVVTVNVTQPGFGSFHADAFCQSRPQSLIGEYFIDCQPGTTAAAVLKSGSTLPVTRTQSTIPADLVQNVLRLPYRERFTLIINELGAAVAGRSSDLQAALQRAVPALTETDNLLNLLANDAQTIKSLNVNADQVITALADNSGQVQRFIDEAGRTATDTATQEAAFQATWHKLPAFLEQLRPTLQTLGTAVDANRPVLTNLNAASGQLDRFFTDLVPFSRASLPALQSLGKASVTGKSAVRAALPLVAHLNTFSKPTPELAQNLAIVLHDLDSQSRAVEPDSRSPGGKGFSGLQALLQYVFNQTLAVNYFGPFGHMLGVDAFVSSMCSPYASPQTVANGLKMYGAQYRQCYAWIGPNQPGINEADPSNPKACVPDPGGEPPYAPPGTHPTGPAAPCKLAADVSSTHKGANAAGALSTGSAVYAASQTRAGPSSGSGSGAATSSGGPAGGSSSAGAGGGTGSGSGGGSGSGLANTLGQILSLFGGGSAPTSSPARDSRPQSSASQSPAQTQQLLNYLLAP